MIRIFHVPEPQICASPTDLSSFCRAAARDPLLGSRSLSIDGDWLKRSTLLFFKMAKGTEKKNLASKQDSLSHVSRPNGTVQVDQKLAALFTSTVGRSLHFMVSLIHGS